MKEQRLLEILESLTLAHRDLLAEFNQERACVKVFDTEGLKKVTAREIEIGMRISALECERARIVSEMQAAYKIEGERVGIDDLAKCVAEPLADMYRARAKALRTLLQEAIKCRNTNNKLIEKVMAFNEGSIRIYLNAGKKELTYSGRGAVSHSQRHVLDSIA